MDNKCRILVTGAAGFIGSFLVQRLLNNGENVLGIDDLNNYYDVNLKKSRLKNIENCFNSSSGYWEFKKISIVNKEKLEDVSKSFNPNIVINLAAQAGVRYSIENPKSYIDSNLVGFSNILEICRNLDLDNFIYASSSSVYGENNLTPFREEHNVDRPVSLYAATKKSNEVLAYAYSHLYDIPTIGLRFFTVYGPWGRPDMAPMIFAKNILKGIPINIFNNGNMIRDFTYIDDVIEGIIKCCYKPISQDNFFEENNKKKSKTRYEIFNIGNNRPVELDYFIQLLENNFGIKAIKKMRPMQMGDVKVTYADTSKLNKWVNYKPNTSIEDGVQKFAKWYKEYYEINL